MIASRHGPEQGTARGTARLRRDHCVAFVETILGTRRAPRDIPASHDTMPLRWVAPGCSWYEQHMLGGCQRPAAHPTCGSVRGGGRGRAPVRQLVVVVPFRGPLSNFETFCRRIPTYLASQGIQFSLVVVNQVDAHPFNRAALVNAAYSALASGQVPGLRFSADADYLAVHDVDRYPVLSNASCSRHVARYYTYPSRGPRQLHSESYTGGVLLIRAAHLRSVNGFSNSFWGWGHEDNDFFLRLRWCGLVPQHAEQLDDCMEHRDCLECRRAKPSNTFDALRSETRSIALVQSRLADPGAHMWRDGLSTLNFSMVAPPRHVECGGAQLHVLDVALSRTDADGQAGRCVADGGAHDNGCIAPVASTDVPPDLLVAAKRGLARESRVLGLAGATRGRVMYNFHYELDLNVEEKNGRRTLQRVGLCSQEWHGPDAPEYLRYHLLWRAVARRNRTESARGARGFRLQKDFHYKAKFPCSLAEAPVRADGRAAPRKPTDSGAKVGTSTAGRRDRRPRQAV